jgi:hypothetical protein
MDSSTSAIVADDVTGFLHVASAEMNQTQTQLVHMLTFAQTSNLLGLH